MFRTPLLRSVALALALGASVTGIAHAKGGCYTQAEYQAEQAIRLHNELMVIGLTCQSLMPEKALFTNYKAFTQRHQSALSQWEKVLTKSMNSQSAFDAFRTRIANESAQRAGLAKPEQFCATHAGLTAEAMAVSPTDLAAFVSRAAATLPVSHTLCPGESIDDTQTALKDGR